MPAIPASHTQSVETEVSVDSSIEHDNILRDEICSSFLSRFGQEAPDFNYEFVGGYEHAWMILRWVMQCSDHNKDEIEIIFWGLNERVFQDLIDFVADNKDSMENTWSERYSWFIQLGL